MGQELSGQRRQRPTHSDEGHFNEHNACHPSGAPAALPPILSAVKQNSEQNSDLTVGRDADRPAAFSKLHLDMPTTQRSVNPHPITDDPVAPLSTADPVTTECLTPFPTRSLTTPSKRPHPDLHDSSPVNPQTQKPMNPHRQAPPLNSHRQAPSANHHPVELPPIVQMHKEPAPRNGVSPQPTPQLSTHSFPPPPLSPAATSTTTVAKQDPTTKVFTEAEIQSILAIDPNRVIVTVNKQVYDVTHFVDGHPGGPSVLRRNNGKDVTDTFFMMHSPHTADRLPEFLMGKLVTEEERNPPAASSANNSALSHELSMDSIRRKLKEDPNRLILIMFGDAYDVTPMRNDHRGGLRVLLNYNGKECGEIFMRVHGILAKRRVHEYYMGRVPELGNAPSPLMHFAEHPPAPKKTGEDINPRVQSTRILEKKKLNTVGTLMTLTFSCEKPLCLTPGGHLKIYSDVERDKWCYYTPFLAEAASFKICVKLYTNGRTSKYLFDQPVGKEIFYEGPFMPSWELQMDSNVKKVPLERRHILLLAGGTGIAPVYSIASHELEKQTTSVTLVCSVHTPSELLLAAEMNRMALQYSSPQPGQQHTLRVAIVFTRVPKHVPVPRTPVESPALVRCGTHIDVSFLKALNLPPTQAAVMCGPPAFNDALAEAVLQAGICPIECIHAL